MNRRYFQAIFLVAAGVAAGLASGAGAQQDRADSLRARRNRVVEVVEKTRRSVVNISSTRQVRARRPSVFGFFLDEIFVYPKTTSGSGFVIHKDGYVVTNAHVVARSADHRVTFADGRAYDAVIVASDPKHDLAVLKIDPPEPLVPLKLGRSDDIMVGEETVAIGNPFGLENTVTRGVVSALHRTLEFSEEVAYRDLIQTDASINPGNSGGPLLNILGELIGINTAIRAEAENVGFAIPVEQLRTLLPDMLNITRLSQVQLGMRVLGDTPRVVSVEDDSPAAKAGVEVGDILQEVDGEALERDVDFYIAMLSHGPDDVVPIKLVRSGRERWAKVHLTPVPKLDGAGLAWTKLGIRLENLNPDTARNYGIRLGVGLHVADIDERGPVGPRGVRRGDLLVEIGDHRVRNLDQAALLLRGVEQGDPVDIWFLRFYRDGTYDQYRQRLFAR